MWRHQQWVQIDISNSHDHLKMLWWRSCSTHVVVLLAHFVDD